MIYQERQVLKMIYRILTENKNRQGLENILKRRFLGFTVTEATGYWQGAREASLIIDIDTLGEEGKIGVYQTAREIKDYNGQESVLVQEIASTSLLVS